MTDSFGGADESRVDSAHAVIQFLGKAPAASDVLPVEEGGQ